MSEELARRRQWAQDYPLDVLDELDKERRKHAATLEEWEKSLAREKGLLAEIERLRQYEPPVSFQGTEIVWDETTEARTVARELFELYLSLEEDHHMFRRWTIQYPWLKEKSPG